MADIKSFSCQARIRVAVVGEQYVDKSAVINCLLHFEHLAMSKNSLKSATVVPTVYRNLDTPLSITTEITTKTTVHFRAETNNADIFNALCIDSDTNQNHDKEDDEDAANEFDTILGGYGEDAKREWLLKLARLIDKTDEDVDYVLRLRDSEEVATNMRACSRRAMDEV